MAVPGRTVHVALATAAGLADVDEDAPLLLTALDGIGVAATMQVWDDPSVDWTRFDLVLVRSTWDYHLRPAEFLGWVDRLPAVSNPAHVLHWNADKRYLRDLSTEVPVVPSLFVEPTEDLVLPAEWLGDVVVKPAISASAHDTQRFSRDDEQGISGLVRRLQADDRVLMVQPYLGQIEADGETSLVFLGGRFSHALRRAPLLTRSPASTIAPGVPYTVVGTATDQQLALARAALGAVPGGPEALTYARVDLAPDGDGQPLLSELELIEPGLWLDHADPAALAHFADAVAEAARTSASRSSEA